MVIQAHKRIQKDRVLSIDSPSLLSSDSSFLEDWQAAEID
jgi:hypothetical protein